MWVSGRGQAPDPFLKPALIYLGLEMCGFGFFKPTVGPNQAKSNNAFKKDNYGLWEKILENAKMVTPARPSALSPARRGGVAILVVSGCENAKMVTPAHPSALSPARRGGVAILVVLGCANAKMVTPARPSALSPARCGGVAILVVLGCENAKMVTPARPSALSPARRGGVAICGGFGL